MYKAKFTIQNKFGFHARPASLLVALSKRYKSAITLKINNKMIDAKSIVNILSNEIISGTEFELQINGSDEKQAAEALTDFLKHFIE